MYVSKRAHTATSEGTFFCAYEKRLGESFYVARLSESCPWPEPPPLTAPITGLPLSLKIRMVTLFI